MNRSSPIQLLDLLKRTSLRRGFVFGFMIIGALLAFEIFNYSTTDFALTDLLGSELKFMGIRWATILSIAFCGIDFAGIARLFTPEQGRDEPTEVWYLFGAWLLAASMNATLTWWGVSVAILNHQAAGSVLLSKVTLTQAVPVFVAMMVWLIRVLIIGTFSIAGERLFSLAEVQPSAHRRSQPAINYATRSQPQPVRPSPKPLPSLGGQRTVSRSEPTYHPVGLGASARDETPVLRR
jgi:hypothetical protein